MCSWHRANTEDKQSTGPVLEGSLCGPGVPLPACSPRPRVMASVPAVPPRVLSHLSGGSGLGAASLRVSAAVPGGPRRCQAVPVCPA